MVRKLDVQVKDTVFEPGSLQKKIYYKTDGKTTWYKAWIFLEGMDLPYVMNVTYRLHSSFPDPNRNVRRTVANPNCQLVLWTWGLFEIKAMVEDKNGRTHELVYDLQYDKELSQKGVEFIEVKT
jgi:transcription initiation factor IIF auxiliary subunit